MLWIKEVEMVGSVDDLRSSRSVAGKKFQNFEMLDAKIASRFEQDHPELLLQERGRFLCGRQIAYMVYDYFRATGGLHDLRLLSSHWCS